MSNGTVRQFPVYADGPSGYGNADSIDPIVDGEAVNGTNLSRPAQNLRSRGEVERGLFEDLLYLADVDRGLLVAGPGKVTWPGSTTSGGTGIFTLSDTLYLQPALTKGAAQTAPVPPVASQFGSLALTRASDSTDAITVTSLLRDYQGGNKINITIESGTVFSCTFADETTMSIEIAATASTDLDDVMTALAALVNDNGDNIVSAALAGAAIGTDLIERPQATVRISGNHDAEGHAVTPAQLAAFFGVGGNPLAEGDTLCVQYSTIIDTSPMTAGGRRQALPENSNTSVGAASLFNSRVSPEKLPNAIPICKVVDGKLCFISGQQVPKGSTNFDLGAGYTSLALTDFFSSCIYNDLGTRFDQGAHAGLTFAVGLGTYWMNGVRSYKAADSVALADNKTNYVYIDTDGDLKASTNTGTAGGLPRLLLYKAVTAGGAITTVTDLRRFHTRVNSKGYVTVNGAEGDFISLEAAIAWAALQNSTGEDSPLKIVVQGDITMTAQIVLARGVTIEGSDISGGHINTPSGTHAFAVATGTVNRVTFRNLTFDMPTAAGTGLINISGDASCSYWELDNCNISGGRDVHAIVATSSEDLTGWKIRQCRFYSMAHTSAYCAIAVQAMFDMFVDGNEFVGGTGDEFDWFIGLFYGSCRNKVTNNRITTGGTAIAIYDDNIAVTLTDPCENNRIAGNVLSSSRSAAYNDNSSGPTLFEGNTVEACNATAAGSNGAVEVGYGIKIIRGNNIHDWVTGAAITINSGTPTMVIEGNTMSSDQAGALYGIYSSGILPGPRVCNNTIDLDRGAGAGAGKESAVAISLAASLSAAVNNNVIRNVGTGGSPSAGVIQVDDYSVVSGNSLLNCRGTKIVGGTGSSIVSNTDDQVPDGARVEGDVTVAGDVYHTTEHTEYVHASQWEFDSSNTASTLSQSGYRSATNAVAICYASLSFLKIGDHITYCQVWYNPNGGGNMQPKVRRLELATGTITDVWAGATDSTGSAIESQNSGVIDHTVASGYVYFVENLHSGAANRTYAAMIKFTRPHP